MKKIITIIVSIVAVIALAGGLTFSYFSTRFKYNSKTAVGNTAGRDGIPLRLRNAPCVPRPGPNSRCRGGVLRGRWRSGRVPWRAGRFRFSYQTGGRTPWLL